MLQSRLKGYLSGFLFLIVTIVFSQNADAQVIIDNLTGGSSTHASTIDTTWHKHEWDIIFPEENRGQQISGPVLYYRLYNTEIVTVNGGFTSGDDGSFIVSPISATTVNDIAPPETDQTDDYLVFDFSGQTLDVPEDGVVWFRFDYESGGNHRMDIGALGTYTTTYQQIDIYRSGGTSFAIYGEPGDIVSTPSIPVPMLSWWAVVTLLLLMGLVVLRKHRISN